MTTLILLRHGLSKWNKLNLFTGWVDIPLSKEGVDEAFAAGQIIKDLPIDIIYTSTLIRAQMTAMLAMIGHHSGKVPVMQHELEGNHADWGKIYNEATEQNTIPVFKAWQLNERMYGELQGLNKAETVEKFGAEQVKIWRRSYDVPPPHGESLEITAARSIPYFRDIVIPQLKQGKNTLITAHGNSLRSIIMDLDGLTKQQVLELELPTGVPVIYNYSDGKFLKQT
ncbi:MAG: 2,3-bisphosphoglycerate-dependent phosphoglycerate mutase [Parachlamydiales bacterium]|jgi:2,3-bisphosphoglycerate-dependent phosphoglycerate mutase